jgi:hypothetical protein
MEDEGKKPIMNKVVYDLKILNIYFIYMGLSCFKIRIGTNKKYMECLFEIKKVI